MEAGTWLHDNFTGLLNAVGIVGGLMFTAFSFRGDRRERELSNLISLTEAHREIWQRFHEEPELGRVLQQTVTTPATEREEAFVTSLILHLYCVYRAIKLGMYPHLEGMRRDVREFYSLPIPNQIWERLKPLQDRDFVVYVDEILSNSPSSRKRSFWRTILRLRR